MMNGQRLLGNILDTGIDALGAALALGLSSSNSARLAAALDTLVAVLVVLLEVLKELLMFLRNIALGSKLGEHLCEALQCLLVEVVLVSLCRLLVLSLCRVKRFLETNLHVAKLREGLGAVVESADIRLDALVSLFVRANVATLSERLSADSAAERLLASVTTHVSLEVPAL